MIGARLVLSRSKPVHTGDSELSFKREGQRHDSSQRRFYRVSATGGMEHSRYNFPVEVEVSD